MRDGVIGTKTSCDYDGTGSANHTVVSNHPSMCEFWAACALVLLGTACGRVGFAGQPTGDGSVISDGARTGTYATAIAADNATSYWPLDDPAPPMAHDVEEVNPGTYTGGVTLGAVGVIASDPAASFDGLSGYVKIGDVFDATGTAAISLEVWISPTTIDSTYRGILTKEVTDAMGREGYLLYVEDPAGLGFERWAAGAQEYIAAPLSTVPPNGFHQVVVTYDGVTANLYVDGVVAATPTPMPMSLPSLTADFVIGARNAGASSYFDGTISDVAVYDHALSPASVLAHFHAAGR